MPAISLAEPFVKPTTMLYRNLLAMETEELLRSTRWTARADGRLRQDHARPADGRLQMGLPCIYLPAGPMLRGNWKGKTLGSGSDAWKYWDERRAGNISDAVAGRSKAASRAAPAPA
jgi:dihydroxyacid dehydratase/phosphogluconate dehydratase